MASLTEFRGMFAIALVDSLEERLYLARDPFGIKPLNWRILPEGPLVFASEIRTLVAGTADLRIDCEAIARYLNYGAMAADQTPFLGVTALPPNSVAAIDRDNEVTVRPILPDGPLTCTRSSAGLGQTLTDSIDLHLGADVPTALLLSAGVDSATIAAVSRRLGRELQCLTVATEGAADESVEAAVTARHYGHRFQRIPAALTDSDVARFFEAMQRPSIDGLNTYLVSKAVNEAGFKVALSGLGGDEALGGYSHFRLLRYLPILRALDRMPGPMTDATVKILSRLGMANEAKMKRLLARGGPREGWGLSLLQREVLPGPLVTDLTGIDYDRLTHASAQRAVCFPTSFSAMAAAEIAIYLQATLLPDADAFTMASSVELRIPFIDRHVFSASLKLSSGKSARPGKKAIGMALDDSYLKRLAARPKRGFTVPMRHWMTGPLAPVLLAADAPDAAVWSVVDRTVAERAGLVPLRARDRWAEAWVLAALNVWLNAVGSSVLRL